MKPHIALRILLLRRWTKVCDRRGHLKRSLREAWTRECESSECHKVSRWLKYAHHARLRGCPVGGNSNLCFLFVFSKLWRISFHSEFLGISQRNGVDNPQWGFGGGNGRTLGPGSLPRAPKPDDVPPALMMLMTDRHHYPSVLIRREDHGRVSKWRLVRWGAR